LTANDLADSGTMGSLSDAGTNTVQADNRL
jgi:hypothetical protein